MPKKANWTVYNLDLTGANETFSKKVCAMNKDLGWKMNEVNFNGGAIALGHPIRASDKRNLATLLHEIEQRNTEKN